MGFEQNCEWFHLPQFYAFSVLGAQNTRDLGTGVPKTRGYPITLTRHFENRRGEDPGDEVENTRFLVSDKDGVDGKFNPFSI